MSADDTTRRPAPPHRPPPLPDPITAARTESGHEKCGEPFLVDDRVVARCGRWVKPIRSRWRRPRREHRGPHRFEWWSTT